MVLIHYSGVEYIYIKGQLDPTWSCDYLGYVLANSLASEKEIYEFLKKGRGKHSLDYGGDIFADYTHRDGDFGYKSRFNGNLDAILQTEEIYYFSTMVWTQVSAGYLREKARANDI